MFLLNDYWMTFALPELFGNHFHLLLSLCSHAGAGVLLASNTGTITASKDGFDQ